MKCGLEVMIVKGVNDSRSELERIEKKISEIGPDRIQINSVFRPPAEKGIAPVDKERLEFALQAVRGQGRNNRRVS